MPPHVLEVAIGLFAALTAGGAIGLERSYNGRAAGFRTHSLVALAAASVAVISFEPLFIAGVVGANPATRLDPTRLSQGVMAGIGFLGAGVIFKEGLSVQGLTTAASVWACAAIGFLCGLGLYWPAGMATVGVLVVLVLFRWIEGIAPWRIYAFAVLRFEVDATPDEAAVGELLGDQRVLLKDVSYRLIENGRLFEYSANIETRHDNALGALARKLRHVEGLVEFELSRISK
jgi:putative Mg2+ transporter-C (MgtC) family protein